MSEPTRSVMGAALLALLAGACADRHASSACASSRALGARVALLERRVARLAQDRAESLESDEQHGLGIEQEAARAQQPFWDALDAQLAAERPEPAWRPEAGIAAYVAKNAPRARISELRCGSSICRVLLRDESARGWASLTEAPDALPPLTSGAAFRYGRDPSELTLYLTRPGRSFGRGP